MNNIPHIVDTGASVMKDEPVAWMDKRTNKCVVFINTPPSDDWIPLYTHPVKELHLSLQKTEDGELIAVTYTDDEHRIVEVLWQKPPVKELTDEEIKDFLATFPIIFTVDDLCIFARAILRKAQEV